MDIIPNKKSNLLYQKGDRKIKGVVDLRCFAKKKRMLKTAATSRVVSEIIRKENFKEKTEGKSIKKFRGTKAVAKPANPLSQYPDFLISKKYSSKKISKQKNDYFNFRFQPSLLFQKSFACFVLFSFFISSIIFAMSFFQEELERGEKV